MDNDRVVCSVATALRNMALDVRNKELIGQESHCHTFYTIHHNDSVWMNNIKHKYKAALLFFLSDSAYLTVQPLLMLYQLGRGYVVKAFSLDTCPYSE